MVRLTRKSTTVGISLAILLIMVMPFSMNSAAQSKQPIGSEWIYNYSDEIYGIIFSGKWDYSCERITSTSLGGTVRDVVEYKSVIWATASLSPSASGKADGEISEIGTEYYDLETNRIVGYVFNDVLTLNATIAGAGSISRDSIERNETFYAPPGGIGNEPSTIYPGDAWQTIYTKHSKSLGHDGNGYFSREFTVNETISYEFVGYETVTVPAGAFNCAHVNMVSSNGIVEDAWYSDSILNYVKISYTVGLAETVTYELDSFALEQQSSPPTEMASNMFLAMFFILIGASVMAVIYASMILKGRKPPEFQSSPSESSEKDIYRP